MFSKCKLLLFVIVNALLLSATAFLHKAGYASKLRKASINQMEGRMSLSVKYDTSRRVHLLHTTSTSMEDSDQKDSLLIQTFLSPNNNNLTQAILDNLNFCDESFDKYLTRCIDQCATEKDKQIYGKIRYELNSVRQKKLMEADQILRDILSAGGLKQMEAKLAYYFRRGDVGMPFAVLLQLNIEDAINSKSEQAAQILMHLRTIVYEQQDSLVAPPVRLLRMLLRTDDTNVRKQMLRQKLVITQSQIEILNEKREQDELVAQPTTVPQCESIVVQPVRAWGGAEVPVHSLHTAIDDVLVQVYQLYANIT